MSHGHWHRGTIADLEAAQRIAPAHVAEAILPQPRPRRRLRRRELRDPAAVAHRSGFTGGTRDRAKSWIAIRAAFRIDRSTIRPIGGYHINTNTIDSLEESLCLHAHRLLINDLQKRKRIIRKYLADRRNGGGIV